MLLVTAEMPAPDTGGTMKNGQTGAPAQTPELLRLHAALERAQASFKLLFEASPEALIRLEDGHFSDCNQAALQLFGVPSTSVFLALQASDLSPLQQPCGRLSGPLLQEHFALARQQRRYRCAWICRRLDTGLVFPCELVIHASSPETDAVLLLEVRVRGSNGQQEEENRAERAYHDPLTHLPNRRLFHDRLINVLAHCRRYGRHAAIIAIDVDTSCRTLDVPEQAVATLIADEQRHEAAQRITAVLRSADTIARLDSDQFVVLLGDVAEARETANANALRVAEKICASFKARHPLQLPQQDGNSLLLDLEFRVSLGIAVYSAPAMQAEALLQQAVDAMQRARAEGCNLIRWAQPG